MPLIGTPIEHPAVSYEPYVKVYKSALTDEPPAGKFFLRVGQRNIDTGEVTITNERLVLHADGAEMMQIQAEMPLPDENWKTFSKRIMYAALGPKLAELGISVSVVE